MSHKRKWRKRTHGTSRQIGKSFIIDDESQQHRKANLPRLGGESEEDRLRRIHRMMAQREAEEEEEAEEAEEEKEKQKRQDRRTRKEILEDEARQELEDKKNKPQKSAGEKLRSAVKAVTPVKSQPTKTIMGVEVPDKKVDEFTLADLPDDLREEVRPYIEDAKRGGGALSRIALNSRFERYLEKWAIKRRIKKEEKKALENQSNQPPVGG